MGDDVKEDAEDLYPCADDDCDVMRTKAEGGTVFTVCDEHRDAFWRDADNPEPVDDPEPDAAGAA